MSVKKHQNKISVVDFRVRIYRAGNFSILTLAESLDKVGSPAIYQRKIFCAGNMVALRYNRYAPLSPRVLFNKIIIGRTRINSAVGYLSQCRCLLSPMKPQKSI